jgi:hypothetical protein
MCPETIRWRAIECMQLAQDPAEPEYRALLLDLAHCWANLANAVERYQLFAEAAEAAKSVEAVSVNDVRPKRRLRNPRAARPRRKRADLARSSPVHKPRRQARSLSLRGIAGR